MPTTTFWIPIESSKNQVVNRIPRTLRILLNPQTSQISFGVFASKKAKEDETPQSSNRQISGAAGGFLEDLPR